MRPTATASPTATLRPDPDAALVRALASPNRGERDTAMRSLVEAHAPRLHATAARLLGDAASAEDVVQDTFLKAWARAADWRPGAALFSTWLHRVTVNACLDRLRKTRPATGVSLDHIADERLSAHARLERADRGRALQTAMDALPHDQRAALALSLSGLSQRDAAAALKITESAYESRLVRARRALRATFQEIPHAV